MLRLLLSAIFVATLTGRAICDTYCEGPSKGWHKFGDNCYLLPVSTSNRVSYYDAEDFCRSKGAHLVSILSEEENKFITDTSASHSFYYGRRWIGLNRLRGPEEYQWSDGQPLGYQNFIHKQQYKKESCFILYGKEGGWRPEHCELHYIPLCKRPASDVEPSPLPPVTPYIPTEGNCPSGWIRMGHKCVQFFGPEEEKRLKFKEAKTACMNLGENHDLVSIHSMEEQAFLTQRLGEFGTSAWIGFNYIESDEVGHDMVFGWTDNSRTNFTFWAPGHPPRGTWKYCAYLNTEGFGKGEWFADYCDLTKRGYICHRPLDASAPEPPPVPESECDEKSVGFGDSCYRYFSSAQTWDQAEATCQKNGGHLVSIKDGYEQSFLYSYVGAKPDSLWTGLRNVKNTRILKWSSDEPLSYSNWGKSRPDMSDLQSSCVSMSVANALQWTVAKCSTGMSFVCEITKVTPPPLPEDVIGSCPSTDSEWIDIGDIYCYQESQGQSKSMRWGDNSRYCMSKGMEMISLSSEYRMKILFSFLWKSSMNYWLSLIRSFDKESFIWTDGSSLDYTNWAENEPSAWSRSYKKDCVISSMNDLKWYPSECSDWSGSLCRTKKTLPGTNVRAARSEYSYHKTKAAVAVAGEHKEKDQATQGSGPVSLLIAAVVCLGLSVFVAAMIFAWKRRDDSELPTTVLPTAGASTAPSDMNGQCNTEPRY